jgi:hypothetical protein
VSPWCPPQLYLPLRFLVQSSGTISSSSGIGCPRWKLLLVSLVMRKRTREAGDNTVYLDRTLCDARDLTQDLLHAGEVLYHQETPPSPP